MLEKIFGSVYPTVAPVTFSVGPFLLCMFFSLLLGTLIGIVYTYKNTYTRSFIVSLALLPAIVQTVIMLVNGNLGTGVAVMGAFSLVRFRSAPGTAKEIASIFMAMAVGLATGTGYIGFAVLFTLIMCAALLLFTLTRFGEPKRHFSERELRITIPESLDYTGVFDDIFEKYTDKCELVKVKTSNLGSLYKLDYLIDLKDPAQEKEFIDELRCRNGNLEITCGKVSDRGLMYIDEL
ncbi:MAG: DUF4956 domain-containing protein [Eubacteriales bacterium]